MSGDMPLVLLNIVNSVLGPELRAKWSAISKYGKELAGSGSNLVWYPNLWQLAAATRADTERAQKYAPQPSQSTAAPTMAMSLEQPLTVKAAPVEEVAEDTAMPVTIDQSGEHAAELTPNAVLVDPIGELTVDTDAETVVPSPSRRASVRDASPPREISPRSRNKSAVQ